MKTELIKKLMQTYNLTKDQIWVKQIGGNSFVIIKRDGIEKIQSVERILVKFEIQVAERDFAVIKAIAHHPKADPVETYGSALSGKGGNYFGSYVCEMAEKRALSRGVLKSLGLYAEGVYSEDESDSFKKNNNKKEIINLNK